MPHSVDTQSATSEDRTSSSTSSANAFPKPVGAMLLVPDQNGEQLSSARTEFSFEDSPRSPQANGYDSDYLVDRKNILRALDRGAPGEKKGTDGARQRTLNHNSRRRNQYYEEQFAYKDTTGSARERVNKDSPVVAELRTNVIIKDEYTLVTDLSYHLSTRFQRPESSIMITVDHSACILLGGSFEPAYLLDITALSTQMQPATNKRNAALVQSFMSDILSVPPGRGVVRFQPIPEENLAISGRTILGEVERLEKQLAEENGGGLKRALTKSSKMSLAAKPKSSLQLSRKESTRTQPTVTNTPISPPGSGSFDSAVQVDTKNDSSDSRPASSKNFLLELSPFDRKVNRTPPTSNIKSKSTKQIPHIPPPPIPEDGPTPKIGKRKSFLAKFRR